MGDRQRNAIKKYFKQAQQHRCRFCCATVFFCKADKKKQMLKGRLNILFTAGVLAAFRWMNFVWLPRYRPKRH